MPTVLNQYDMELDNIDIQHKSPTAVLNPETPQHPSPALSHSQFQPAAIEEDLKFNYPEITPVI